MFCSEAAEETGSKERGEVRDVEKNEEGAPSFVREILVNDHAMHIYMQKSPAGCGRDSFTGEATRM